MITQQFRICDVCRLLDFDVAHKLCSYCSMCDAWICSDDLPKWARRIKAALKRKLEAGYQGSPNYEEVAVPNYKNILEDDNGRT